MATEYNFDTFEKETKELVATLKRLNDEIEKNKNSKDQLNKVSDALSKHIQEVKESSVKTMNILQDLGNVELKKIDAQVIKFTNTADKTITKIDSIESVLSKETEKLDKITKKIDLDLLVKKLQNVDDSLKKLSNLEKNLNQTSTSIDGTNNKINDTLDDLKDVLKDVKRETKNNTEALSDINDRLLRIEDKFGKKKGLFG